VDERGQPGERVRVDVNSSVHAETATEEATVRALLAIVTDAQEMLASAQRVQVQIAARAARYGISLPGDIAMM